MELSVNQRVNHILEDYYNRAENLLIIRFWPSPLSELGTKVSTWCMT